DGVLDRLTRRGHSRVVGVRQILHDLNGRGVAEVVGRVGVGDGGTGRVVGVLAGDGADVGLLAGHGGGGLRVGPGLGQVEQVVVVGIAGGASDRAEVVVRQE